MKRRILSLILVVVMVLPVLSATVLAANDPIITSHHYGESYEADDFYIKWNAVSGANRYRLAVLSLTDKSYAADIYWYHNLTTNSYRVDEDNIKPGHTYKIWVGACGSSHEDVISQYSIVVTAMESEDDDDYYEPYYNEDYYYDDGYDDDYYDDGYNDKYYGGYDEEEEYFYNDTSIPWDGGGFGNDDNGNFSNTPQQGRDETNADGSWVVVEPVHEHTYIDYYNNHTEYELIEGNETYHYYINYFDRKCSECEGVYEYDVEGDWKIEKHYFGGDLICDACDYERICDHKEGTYKSREKNLKHEPISGDANYHYTTKGCDMICNTCHAVVEKGKVTGVVKEWHNYPAGTTKCSICGYEYVWQPKYEVEQLINQGTLPFVDYNNAAITIISQKDITKEAWKGLANMSFADKCKMFLNNTPDAFYEEYWKLVFMETLEQATGHQLDQLALNTVSELNNFLATDFEMSESSMSLIRSISKKLDTSVVYLRNASITQKWEDIFNKYGDKFETASYATQFLSAIMGNYVDNAQYLMAMQEMVDDYIEQKNPTYAKAMQRAMDYTMMRYQNNVDASLATLLDIGEEMWEDKIISSAESFLIYIGEKGLASILVKFQVVDLASHIILEMTGQAEKFSASTKSIFMCSLALHFQNEFCTIGNDRRKDGFDYEDNKYMRNIFELCRATQYKTYDYFSIQYTDSGNQAWLGDVKNSILGRSIKSYLY